MSLQSERSYTYPVKLPPSIRQRAADVARLDGTSLNYFINTAIAEKMNRLVSRFEKYPESAMNIPEASH